MRSIVISCAVTALMGVTGCGGDDATTSRGDGGSTPDGSLADAGGPGESDGATPADATSTFSLTSPEFEEGDTLPASHRCTSFTATGPSPELEWSGAPADTKSFAIVIHDLDYNGFLHWVIFDIPATTSSLPAGVPLGATPASPAGARQMPVGPATPVVGYFGPCSPTSTNTYEFTLFALDTATLEVGAAATSAEAVTAIESHAIGSTKLTVESGPT